MDDRVPQTADTQLTSEMLLGFALAMTRPAGAFLFRCWRHPRGTLVNMRHRTGPRE